MVTELSLPRVNASRYITSLREGGSLPALVDADDGRRYVAKLRGAGQGSLALVAEIVTGELARKLDLRVPRIALVELDPAFAKNEPDAEVQDLFRASSGLNAGLEFLPGATTFDVAAGDWVSAAEAARIVWLDAFTLNVDRTPRNPNLLQWKGETWLIDHGASLYFHHNWATATAKTLFPFAAIRDHVLLPFVGEESAAAAAFARERITPAVLREVFAAVPEAWLLAPGDEASLDERRAAYLKFFCERLAGAAAFEEEILRARAV